MSDHHNSDEGHGNSPAAWAAVVMMLVAFSVGTVAFIFSYAAIVWVCAGVVLLGPVLGVILAKLGYGVGGSRYAPKGH